jgi:hypothetical protein
MTSTSLRRDVSDGSKTVLPAPKKDFRYTFDSDGIAEVPLVGFVP